MKTSFIFSLLNEISVPQSDVEAMLLCGSRANKNYQSDSDWDVVVQTNVGLEIIEIHAEHKCVPVHIRLISAANFEHICKSNIEWVHMLAHSQVIYGEHTLQTKANLALNNCLNQFANEVAQAHTDYLIYSFLQATVSWARRLAEAKRESLTGHNLIWSECIREAIILDGICHLKRVLATGGVGGSENYRQLISIYYLKYGAGGRLLKEVKGLYILSLLEANLETQALIRAIQKYFQNLIIEKNDYLSDQDQFDKLKPACFSATVISEVIC